MIINTFNLAKKYIKTGKEFLNKEYDIYESVTDCWWGNKTYGHTLCVKF